jgi:hypothetical protein
MDTKGFGCWRAIRAALLLSGALLAGTLTASSASAARSADGAAALAATRTAAEHSASVGSVADIPVPGAQSSVAASSASSAEISTLAGSVVPGPGPATSIGIDPFAVAAHNGNLFVADPAANVVREITGAGAQVVIAGNGGWGTDNGDGGPATSAGLFNPVGLAVDAHGDVFIAEYSNGLVRMVAGSNCASSCPLGLPKATAHDIYTVAGGGTAVPGDGGPARSAGLSGPAQLAVDSKGDLLIADSGENRVQMVAAAPCSSSCPYGLGSMTVGDIYTVAGSSAGGYAGDGGPATSAELSSPNGVATDARGDLLIADRSNSRVRFVAAASCSTSCPYGLPSTKAWHIYTVAGNGSPGYSGDGGPGKSAELQYATGVGVDANGDVLIADTYNYRVRMVAASTCSSACPFGLASTKTGAIYTVAGDGLSGSLQNGIPATAAFVYPSGIALDSAGDIAIADNGDLFVRVVAAKACSSSCPYGLSSTNVGDIYTVGGNYTFGFSGDAGPATSAQMSVPAGVTVYAGNVLIADTDDNRVRMVAGSSCPSSCPFGLPSTVAGAIYTVAGTGAIGYAGDGGPAISASIWLPEGVAVDAKGDLLIADDMNARVRLVAKSSCSSSCPFGLTSMTAGDIYTVAGNGTLGYAGDGGPATAGELNFFSGVAVDHKGDLLIADSDNHRVRMVAASSCSSACPFGRSTLAGDIYTVAGNGTYGFSGDGGPGASAEVASPSGVAVDANGDALFADAGNNRVRILAAASCSSSCPFKLATTKRGDIYTVAGNGGAGAPGDGGPATSAGLPLGFDPFPSSVALDSKGDLLITTNNLFVAGSSRVRMVASSSCSSSCPFGLSSTTADYIYTVAGGGSASLNDHGFATATSLGLPSGVAVNSRGDLIFADNKNDRIRIVAVPPRNTSRPVISGTDTEGDTLTATAGSWSAPSAVSYGYTWERCSGTGTACARISGGNGSSYKLTSSDVGHEITVSVTATDLEGMSAAATAKPVGPITS